MRKTLFFILLFPLVAMARFTATDALLSAPDELVGQVGRAERLDLIDYQKAGLSNRTAPNRLGGKAGIAHFSQDRIDLLPGEAQSIAILLLPAKNDTLIGIISTLETPAPDSRLKIFNRQWEPQPKAWSEPTSKAWGNPKAEFLLTEYTFSGDTLSLHDRTDLWNKEKAPSTRTLRFRWSASKSKFVSIK